MKIQLLIVISLMSFYTKAQVIMQQDFEGPLTGGWSTTGQMLQTFTNTNGFTYSSQSNDFMINMGFYNEIETPNFSKLGQKYYVSFWFINYKLVANESSLKLYDNNGEVLNFGYYDNVSDHFSWQFREFVIPAAYIGNYYLRWYTSNGNVLVDNIKVSKSPSSSVGINQNHFKSHFKVYKDFNNEGIINISYAKSINDLSIKITNTLGQTILNKTTNSQLGQTEQINTANLKSGIYIVSVSNGSFMASYKIFI